MTELPTGAPHVAYGCALLCLQARNILTHFKIFLIFLYSFAVMSTVAPGHVNAASFQLTWVDNSQDEDGFNIERKLNTNGTFSLIATVGPDVTSYVDDNLANTTTYCYRVNAFNDAGNSAYTNEACGTTPATSPLPSGNRISTNIANGAILSGSSVVWTATPSGSPVRVEFFIDGALLSTEYVSPYQFNGDPSGTLNTNTLSNGSHQLKVRAIYSDNSTAEQTITVTVSNGTTPTPLPPSGNGVSTNIANGAILSGSSVVWTATPSGSPVRVEFFIDGALLSTEYVSPYQFNGDPSGTLNTNTLSNGSHQLKVRAIYSDNSTAEQTITVTVSNGTTPTPPPPLSSSTVTATLLGQTGEDIVGTTSETPDGIQDVHIRLSGVQGTITGVRITGGDLGGRWETPFNGANWVVAIRPQTNPSLVDLYFDFFRPNSFYNLDLTFADGSTQTIQTSIVLSTAVVE